MPTQIVMNHNGDTRHHFDANDAEALAKAEARFKQLTGKGFIAAIRTKPGACRWCTWPRAKVWWSMKAKPVAKPREILSCWV